MMRQILVLLCVLCSAVGCQTAQHRSVQARHEFFSNELTAAHAGFEKVGESRSTQTVAELDLAMVELFQGRPESAERRLRSVRDEWDRYRNRSLAEEGAALLSDDRVKVYTGEYYEQMTLGVMLALCSLMDDGVDAESYTLQTLHWQQDLVAQLKADQDEPVEPALGIPPVVPYLRGMLRESTLHDQDDALKMYEWTAQLLPGQPQVAHDVERARTGNHSQPGHGVVYVFALVGQGPHKVEKWEPVTQTVMLQAEQLLSMLGKYRIPPTLAPIKIPVVACKESPFDVVGLQVNGQPVATTLTMTDFNQLARETYQAQMNRMMARTVARRIAKKSAIYAAKHSLQAQELGAFALDALSVAWEATESADLRGWGLLPRELQVARIELPAGQHELVLEPVRDGRPCGTSSLVNVEVADAQNTFVLGFWPDEARVGELLVNRPPLR